MANIKSGFKIVRGKDGRDRIVPANTRKLTVPQRYKQRTKQTWKPAGKSTTDK